MKKIMTLFLLALLPLIASAYDAEVDGIYYNLITKAKQAEVTSGNTKYTGNVTIPESFTYNGVTYSVTTIGKEAFSGCSDMTSIEIPKSVTSIGSNAFYGCKGMKKVYWNGKMEDWCKIKFADEYSDPIAIEDVQLLIIEKVKTTVKFTAPIIKKVDEDFEDISVVSFNGTRFKNVCYLEIPEAQDAQKYLAGLLFGEKNCGLKEACDKFLKLWGREEFSSTKPVNNGSINIDLRKEYEQYGRFACYHVTASLDGRVQILGLPQTNSVEKQKEQYFKLVNGVDYRFIVDTKQNKMVGIEQIFVPGLVDKLKGAFGADVSLYVEDRCLQLLSKKSDGRFIFNKTTEVHFTDYFKQLVGWNEIQNIDTPAFLHGQEGLEDFLKKQYVSLASEFTPADTVTVSMIILEDGSVTQPTIECKPNNYHEQKLLETCGKMPKWMPAYKDGKPVTKEAFFSIRVPRVSNEKAHDVVEIMPSFNGGMGALMQFLSSNIKYPEECEENGIQGRVICTFVVERDGSITDLKVTKPVHPLLDKEALRVLSLMPKWIPGTQKGETVRVKYTLPVTFRLK